MMRLHGRGAALLAALMVLGSYTAFAASTLQIMPYEGARFVTTQRFDVRVEATDTTAPAGLRVYLDGVDITSKNILDVGSNGERGFGGTGATSSQLPANQRAGAAPPNTSNFLIRQTFFKFPGSHTIEARLADGNSTRVEFDVVSVKNFGKKAGVKNVILLLGDGMGAAHRTAARVLSRTYLNGRPTRGLAMDSMEVTGMVMTSSLNSLITDSSPGMATYVSGSKANNNQEGVYPDNTSDAFDNPRVEYLGELLRRTRGAGFNVGLVTTSDLTDATPAANAIHTSNRNAGPQIAAQYIDERATNGVTVLLGGGRNQFAPGSGHARDLPAEFQAAGYNYVTNATELQSTASSASKILGIFHPSHMSVAFDKIGLHTGYSQELVSQPTLQDQPLLDDMARSAINILQRTSPDGFYLMIEGASIDKRAHDADAERTIWDTIEFDNAIQVALDFARSNGETLVLVTADHECAGMALAGVGNDAFYPATTGTANRDYVATFRLFPNYVPGPGGYPVDPDPSRKLIIGWASAPDHFENFISNRLQRTAAVVSGGVAVANPARDGGAGSDNTTVSGIPVEGFLVPGIIENGALGAPATPTTSSDHTASDIPLSAAGRGAERFTGTFDNTDTFFKILSAAGSSLVK